MATLNMFWYGRGLESVKNGEIDWANDTIKVALIEDTYVPDQGADEFFSDVNADEASGAGYTAGGEALTTKVVNYDAANLHVTYDADDVTWANSSIAARYAVIYKDTGTASTSQLIGYGDAGATEESVDADFDLNWNTDGILRTTATAQ